jgi:hypothetical protein
VPYNPLLQQWGDKVRSLFVAWEVGQAGLLTVYGLIIVYCLYEQETPSDSSGMGTIRVRIMWCPKYRRKILIDDVAERLKQIISEVCQEH